MILSLKLGHFFGTSPEFWLNLQSLYGLRLAEQSTGKTTKPWKQQELLIFGVKLPMCWRRAKPYCAASGRTNSATSI